MPIENNKQQDVAQLQAACKKLLEKISEKDLQATFKGLAGIAETHYETYKACVRKEPGSQSEEVVVQQPPKSSTAINNMMPQASEEMLSKQELTKMLMDEIPKSLKERKKQKDETVAVQLNMTKAALEGAKKNAPAAGRAFITKYLEFLSSIWL